MWQRLTCCTLKGRRLRVFYDQRGSLPLAERFDENLVRAIELSAVFVPIVSRDALSHINANIERNTVDWLLLEWMHALHIARQPGSTLRIFPIIFGHKDVPGAAGARRMSTLQVTMSFQELIDSVADATPHATIAELRSLRPDSVNTVPTARALVAQLFRHQSEDGSSAVYHALGRARTAATKASAMRGNDWARVPRLSRRVLEVAETASQARATAAAAAAAASERGRGNGGIKPKFHGTMSGQEGIAFGQVVSEVQAAGAVCTLNHNAQGSGSWFTTWKTKLWQANGTIVFSDKYRQRFTEPLRWEAGAILRIRRDWPDFQLLAPEAPGDGVRANIMDGTANMGDVAAWERFVTSTKDIKPKWVDGKDMGPDRTMSVVLPTPMRRPVRPWPVARRPTRSLRATTRQLLLVTTASASLHRTQALFCVIETRARTRACTHAVKRTAPSALRKPLARSAAEGY